MKFSYIAKDKEGKGEDQHDAGRREVYRIAADKGVHIAVLKLEPNRQPTVRRLESDARVFRAHAE